jgi:hypothetical protein
MHELITKLVKLLRGSGRASIQIDSFRFQKVFIVSSPMHINIIIEKT